MLSPKVDPSIEGGIQMDNVVVLSIASNVFWLTIVLVVVIFFRSEIKGALGSLSSVSVAGSHFELGDKTQTLKSYTILSNIFLDLLCNSNNNERLVEVFSEVNAQQLTNFTIKYLKEAPKEDVNFLLMRNIAYIAGRRANLKDALSLYQILIDKAPTDWTLRNNMGIVLYEKNPSEARKVFFDLMNENPGVPLYKYNYALTNIELDNFDEGVSDLLSVIKAGRYSDPDMFVRPAIQKLAKVRPEDYQKVVTLSAEAKDGQQS